MDCQEVIVIGRSGRAARVWLDGYAKGGTVYWRQQSMGAAQSFVRTAAMRRTICNAEGRLWVGSSSSQAN
jgi:hypothetical protein